MNRGCEARVPESLRLRSLFAQVATPVPNRARTVCDSKVGALRQKACVALDFSSAWRLAKNATDLIRSLHRRSRMLD